MSSYIVKQTNKEEDIGLFSSSQDFKIGDTILLGDRYIVRSKMYDVLAHTVVLICDNLTEFDKMEDEIYSLEQKETRQKQNNRKWWQIF